METANNTPVSSRPPHLTSDQLNYLIWRYLQESGYGEAAVKLQRDWNVNAEALPFAKHVRGQALVSLVQKGLKYHHMSVTIDENGRPSKQLTPSLFFFGPESDRPTPEAREVVLRPPSSHRAPSPDNVANLARKHAIETGSNGLNEGTPQPVPKRSRKTTNAATIEQNGAARKPVVPMSASLRAHLEVDAFNGHPSSLQDASPSADEIEPEENASPANGAKEEDRMDVDTDGEQPVAIEVLPPVASTLASGESVGVQFIPAKVSDLGPHTKILDMPGGLPVEETAWRPQDRAKVATHGSSICGIWRSPTFTSKPEFQALMNFSDRADNVVTAVAWEPNGTILAVATSTDYAGEVHLYDGEELALLESLPASQRTIIRLQWQEAGLRLVGIAPFQSENSEGSSILLWDLSSTSGLPGPSAITVKEILDDLDVAVCEGNGVACASGGRTVYQCRTFPRLELEREWTSQLADVSDRWAHVKCAWRSQFDTLLVAASSESGRIWLPVIDKVHEAHQGPITDLQIRPSPMAGRQALSTSEFATCAVDGTIKAWRYNKSNDSVICFAKLTLGLPQGPKTLAYSPDGFCLAGASYGNVRIWNAEHGYHQMANWQGEDEQWRGNKSKDEDLVSNGAISSINGDNAGLGQEHSLAWDSDSKKLAFGLGSQIALIDFQR